MNEQIDNQRFGAFIAQLRKEQNMTQKELADQFYVTDKAVSKWETGKSFPDLKLMEPLAQALGVTLVELIQGERQQGEILTIDQAETVVAQALDQSERTTARKYLKLFRWCLTGIGFLCAAALFPHLMAALSRLHFHLVTLNQPGVIGGATMTTYIVTKSVVPPTWLLIGAPAVLLVICVILAIRVWRLERKLK